MSAFLSPVVRVVASCYFWDKDLSSKTLWAFFVKNKQGSFAVELYHKHTPRTCYNIAALAHAGYYDGVIFHRVVRDVIVQGGDPTGTGRGGESVYGGKFEDEITRNLKHTGAGVLVSTFRYVTSHD